MTKEVGTIGPHPLDVEALDFQTAVSEGRVFTACNQSSDTSSAGLSATTPVLTLANPLGSGVKGRLHFAGCVNLIAFAAAAAVWLAAGTNSAAAVVTGTAATVRRTRLGGLTNPGNEIAAFVNATLPAAPVAISVLGAYLTGAITTQSTAAPMGRWYNGAVEIMPGTNISIQFSTVSGNAIFCEYIWEEVAI